MINQCCFHFIISSFYNFEVPWKLEQLNFWISHLVSTSPFYSYYNTVTHYMVNIFDVGNLGHSNDVCWKSFIIYAVFIITLNGTIVQCFFIIFFFYLDFLSRAFPIHRAVGKGGGYLFNFTLPPPPTLRTFRNYPGNYCRATHSQYSDSNREPLVFERKSLTIKLRARMIFICAKTAIWEKFRFPTKQGLFYYFRSNDYMRENKHAQIGEV